MPPSIFARFASHTSLRHAAAILAVAAAFDCGGNVTSQPQGAGGAGSSGSTTTDATTGATNGTASTSTGVPVDWGACDGPGQCMLAVPGCCGGCGVPELESFTPINGEKQAAFHESTCPEPEPCPDCLFEENGSLFAKCRSGQCIGADLRKHPYGECGSNQDCVLRWGSGCCESCNPYSDTSLTALNPAHLKDLLADVCSPDGSSCPPCAPPEYPPGATAICAGGQCLAVFGD